MYPSEILNIILNKSDRDVTLIEQNFMDEFASFVNRTSGTLYNELLSSLQKEPLELIMLLRTQFLANSLVPKSFIHKFYEILQKYAYHTDEEILKCIKDVTILHDMKNKSFWEKTPYIKEISYNKGNKTFTLESYQDTFSFISSKEIYLDEISTIKKIGQEQSKINPLDTLPNGYNIGSFTHFDYKCHKVALAFAMLHPEYYVAIAICPYGFGNYYWLHSYNVSQDLSSVIDLPNGFVMPISDFERLVKPQVLFQTKGSEIHLHLAQIYNSFWPFTKDTEDALLKMLAFYHYDLLSEKEREEKYGNILHQLIRK